MDVSLDPRGAPKATRVLFIYLFLLKAAADCPEPGHPERPGNTVLSNEALLMNDFPEGSVVTLECSNGYVKESGSETITCISGNWSESDLTCKKKDCGVPEAQSNMKFDISGGTLFGAEIKVICDKGYHIRGPSYRVCYSRGWSGDPVCQIVTCKKPANVSNGRSSWDSQDAPKYGESIHYSCDEGYTLVGKDTIVCGETGEYDSPPPECKEASRSTDLSPTAYRGETPTVSPSAQGGTTEDVITTTMVTHSTSTPPAQETSGPTDLSATPTTHRDKTVTTPTVSTSAQGGRHSIAGDKDNTTTANVISEPSLFQDEDVEPVDINKNIGHATVIFVVTGVLFVGLLMGVFLYKYLLKRKGSYDTREDLKPELLQFQNL